MLYLILFLLLIDQGLLNILIISQSIHNQTGTQLRYVGFQTKGSISDQIGYNKYITREAT